MNTYEYDDVPDEYHEVKHQRQQHRREMNSELGNPEFETDEEQIDD